MNRFLKYGMRFRPTYNNGSTKPAPARLSQKRRQPVRQTAGLCFDRAQDQHLVGVGLAVLGNVGFEPGHLFIRHAAVVVEHELDRGIHEQFGERRIHIAAGKHGVEIQQKPHLFLAGFLRIDDAAQHLHLGLVDHAVFVDVHLDRLQLASHGFFPSSVGESRTAILYRNPTRSNWGQGKYCRASTQSRPPDVNHATSANKSVDSDPQPCGFDPDENEESERMERAMRFELTTSTLARLRSTPELRPLFLQIIIIIC